MDMSKTLNLTHSKMGCKVYHHINKKTGRKKLHKKSMMGFLVEYQPGGIYRIYHPGTKEFKVSRDVVFSENQFFDTREVVGNVGDILPMAADSGHDSGHDSEHDSGHDSGYESKHDPGHDSRHDSGSVGDDGDHGDNDGAEEQAENAPPIIYNEIMVQPFPTMPPSATHTPSVTTPNISKSSPKPPNRRTRRMIARAFKAVVKGNWKWPRNYHEAMEAEDAGKWEIAMQKEYDSIMKNETWKLVPRPEKAKVVKSRWVLRIKDANHLYKARFCAKGFTQR